jgi:hypothetical protein
MGFIGGCIGFRSETQRSRSLNAKFRKVVRRETSHLNDANVASRFQRCCWKGLCGEDLFFEGLLFVQVGVVAVAGEELVVGA